MAKLSSSQISLEQVSTMLCRQILQEVRENRNLKSEFTKKKMPSRNLEPTDQEISELQQEGIYTSKYMVV